MEPTTSDRKEQIDSKKLVTSVAKDFAETTSMHGIKLIARDDISVPERLLWAILFLIGFFFAITWSVMLWNKWESNPVLTTVHSANCPMNTYPFPSVTICSVNKISTKGLGHWMENTPELTSLFKLSEIRRILQIISANRAGNEKEILALSELLNKANISSNNRGYERIIQMLSPKCSSMILHCLWEEKEEDCAEIFGTETTDDGYCCSFNSIILTKDGPIQHPKVLKYARNIGVYAGLRVILNSELDDYNVTSSFTSGFKVSIQRPDDFARTGRIGFLASPGRQVDVAVTGEALMANPDRIRNIDIDKRGCALSGEIKLEHFDDYTGPYCQLDCQARIFVANCGCVPYYFPGPVSSKVPVCNLSSYYCLENTGAYYVLNRTYSCECPLLCNAVSYRNEVSRGSYWNPVIEYPSSIRKRPEFRRMETDNQYKEYAKSNFVQLNVYLKSITGICFIMDVRTTWADFISATGGLLGLGFGFSILSAAEVLYFLLIRWIYSCFQARREQRRKETTAASVHPREPNGDDHRSHLRNRWVSDEGKTSGRHKHAVF